MQPGNSQPRQMTPRPQMQSPGPHFNNGGQNPPRMPQNQFQGTPQFRGQFTTIFELFFFWKNYTLFKV